MSAVHAQFDPREDTLLQLRRMPAQVLSEHYEPVEGPVIHDAEGDDIDCIDLLDDAIVGAYDKADTIEYLKDRIKRATEAIPAELETLREERRELLRRIHQELLGIRTAYEELYAPVQKFASEAAGSAETTDTLQLQFDAYLSPGKFQESFLDFIRKNRKGSFYGEDESRKAVIDLLNAHDFGTTDGVVDFADAVYSALTEYDRDGTPEKVSIESQLRQNKTVLELYDYLFGLGYLEVRYTLRLGGKDISQLSPGEKGALLLVFYLLLGRDPYRHRSARA